MYHRHSLNKQSNSKKIVQKEAGGPKVTGYFKETPKRPIRMATSGIRTDNLPGLDLTSLGNTSHF